MGVSGGGVVGSLGDLLPSLAIRSFKFIPGAREKLESLILGGLPSTEYV